MDRYRRATAATWYVISPHFRAKGKLDRSRADAYTDRKQTYSVTYDLYRRRGSSMHEREGLWNEQLLRVGRTG